ncbi:hypothetical protein C8R42DRAFT_714089 [Lentinula raphanica]|nr:hypothetical protein C8R42DRAFT_714089 [Lentinula raphanica]
MYFVRLSSLIVLAASVYGAIVNASAEVSVDVAPSASATHDAPSSVATGSYIDIEIADPSASNGHIDIKLPLEEADRETYNSIVADAEHQLASADCIPVGSFCTWGYWDCCGSAGCLLFGLVGGVCT